MEQTITLTMENILDKLGIELNEQTSLSSESRFSFNCHSGLECFNSCCSNLDIVLTPYDILCMKKHLGITSAEFISEYTEHVIQKESKLPFLKLRLGEEGKCRFVAPEGCTIYDNRPAACRYYPLGFGIYKNEEAGDDFYFLIKEDHCKGFGEKREWTVGQWRKNQGIDVYDDKNRVWMEVILNKKLYSPELEPDEKSLKMFFMASYDLDAFREFVFESRFLQLFDIEEERLEIIRGDDSELMLFAHQWLLYALFRKPTMNLKEG